jgi:hypothetical protein
MIFGEQLVEQVALYLLLVPYTSAFRLAMITSISGTVWRSTSAIESTSGTATGVARTWDTANKAIEQTAKIENFIMEGFE